MTKVWDGFIRGFHWLLVLGLVVLYISGEQEWMDLHFVMGYLVLALFATRLIWGLLGSDTAKLSALFHSPRAVKQAITSEPKQYGHNPAGSYMVLVFFVLIAVQLLSGLMTTDDILMEGPLVAVVSSDWVELAGTLHHANIDFLIAAIVVHIVAIVVYRLKGKNLVKTLVTGKTAEHSELPVPSMKKGIIGYAIFIGLSVLVLLSWGSEPLKNLFG